MNNNTPTLCAVRGSGERLRPRQTARVRLGLPWFNSASIQYSNMTMMMVESSCEANQRDPTLQSHQVQLCAMHAGTLSAMLTNTNNMCIYVVAGFLTDSILHWKTNPATRQQDDPGCLPPHLAQFDLSAALHKYKTSTPLFAFYSSDFWHFVLLSIGKRSGAHWEHNVSKSLPCILQKK